VARDGHAGDAGDGFGYADVRELTERIGRHYIHDVVSGTLLSQRIRLRVSIACDHDLFYNGGVFGVGMH